MANITVKQVSKIEPQIRLALARDMVRRGTHVESAAKRRIAEAPRRVDTGRLRASIHTTVIAWMGVSGARVGTPVEYSLYVHNGTKYMKKNPYLKDSLMAVRL